VSFAASQRHDWFDSHDSMLMSTTIHSWKMTAPGLAFMASDTPAPALAEGEALVAVAGCGVCHTDISFWHHGVNTRHPLPLTLGHEISGSSVRRV
jgi:6-hydroxycyclohex-1-ene-1-carbonyl-CoA dehydrogenase